MLYSSNGSKPNVHPGLQTPGVKNLMKRIYGDVQPVNPSATENTPPAKKPWNQMSGAERKAYKEAKEALKAQENKMQDTAIPSASNPEAAGQPETEAASTLSTEPETEDIQVKQC